MQKNIIRKTVLLYHNHKKNSIMCQLSSCICCLILSMGVAAFLLWHFLGRPTKDDVKDVLNDVFDFGDFKNVLGNLTNTDFGELFDKDPFGLTTPDDNDGFFGDDKTHVWETNGNGLQLELQNALDENWYKEFDIAVNDWSQSNALTLKTKQIDIDRNCKPVIGVMKVCNGNYGNTGWLGINEIEIKTFFNDRRGYIISSVAKMNEYYLHNANYEQRQYTMCHEIGHGFGLPHTDENPYNTNLGNCLDYTNDPKSNMHPGKINFQRLAKLYLDHNNNQDILVVETKQGQQQQQYHLTNEREGKESKSTNKESDSKTDGNVRIRKLRHYLHI